METKTYSEVLCNFLLGLHAYRGSPDYVSSDSIEKEFNGVMKEIPINNFDENSYDKFLPEYLQITNRKNDSYSEI
ncbi:hypothetical protein COOONC_22516 [Cooperia oncophora]